MKKWFEQFKTEDWVVVAVSILLLAFAIITPNYLPRIPKHLADTESWGNAIFLFVIVLVILYIGWLLLGRPLKGLFLSLIAVFSPPSIKSPTWTFFAKEASKPANK